MKQKRLKNDTKTIQNNDTKTIQKPPKNKI